MKAYKGLNEDMTCRGFRFEEGKTYEHEGKVEVCKSGFHACEDAVDVFNYYAPAESVYHEVELEDVVTEGTRKDTKVSARKITIGARLSIAQMIKACIDFRFGKVTSEKEEINKADSGAASATGDRGAASATGYRGAASATGYRGVASATGDSGAASATGDSGAASATGYRGAASATGDSGAASATGKAGVALAAGLKCRAMGEVGCALMLVEREWDCEDCIHKIVNVAAVIVDGKKIKANTWYMLKGGKIVEC